jgi:hypothetical protein
MDAFESEIENPPFKGFKVYGDVGKFRQSECLCPLALKNSAQPLRPLR